VFDIGFTVNVAVDASDTKLASRTELWQTLRHRVASKLAHSPSAGGARMKSIEVAIDVPQSREQVFSYLDVLGNHEVFTDHMLVDWTCSGPAKGVGAKARMRAKAPGKEQWIDMTAISSTPPKNSVEEAIGAGGRRRTQGTYVLDELPDGGTAIHFRLTFLELPPLERLFGPLIRLRLKRDNSKAMERLKETLAHLPSDAEVVQGRAAAGDGSLSLRP